MSLGIANGLGIRGRRSGPCDAAPSPVHAIWIALNGTDPATIRAAITAEYDYDLTRTVDRIRPGYAYNETCQCCVPEAVTCALESTSFDLGCLLQEANMRCSTPSTSFMVPVGSSPRRRTIRTRSTVRS